MSRDALRQAMADTRTNDGRSLLERSEERPLLVIFLRHLGCTFCREALGDVKTRRHEIQQSGTDIVLVHMATEEQAQPFFNSYGLADLPRVSDPDRTLYRAFDLKRGSLWQLFGPKNWVRGAAATFKGHGVGKLVGDGFQMPGVFLVENGRVVRAFRHEAAGSRPDYEAMACPINPGAA